LVGPLGIELKTNFDCGSFTRVGLSKNNEIISKKNVRSSR